MPIIQINTDTNKGFLNNISCLYVLGYWIFLNRAQVEYNIIKFVIVFKDEFNEPNILPNIESNGQYSNNVMIWLKGMLVIPLKAFTVQWVINILSIKVNFIEFLLIK